MTFYRLSKLVGGFNLDITAFEIEKCNKNTLVFDGGNCVSNALDFFLKFKGEERKVINKIVEYYLHLHGHNGSGLILG